MPSEVKVVTLFETLTVADVAVYDNTTEDVRILPSDVYENTLVVDETARATTDDVGITFPSDVTEPTAVETATLLEVSVGAGVMLLAGVV